MLKVGVGQSTTRTTSRAIEEAAGQAMARAGINHADLALVFFTVDHLANREDLTSTLRLVTKTDQVVGCSAAGVLTSEGEIEGEAGVAVLVLASDSLYARPFLFQPLREREREVGGEIIQTLRAASEQNSHLVLFSDPYNGRADQVVQEVEENYGFVPVVGAGSSEDGSQGKTFQLCGEQITTNALSGLLLTGSFDSSIGVSQGCQPVSKPMVITKAEGNLIFEIDHRPAFEVFTQTIKGPLLEDLRRALAFVFIGLPADPQKNSVEPGSYLVRNIIGLDSQKGILAIGENVHAGENMIFTLREPQRAREDLDQMLQRQVAILDGKKPQLGLYFNCCARGTSLYGLSGIDTAYIQKSLGEFPLIGFFGSFELGPMGMKNHLLAYTGVLVLITERQN